MITYASLQQEHRVLAETVVRYEVLNDISNLLSEFEFKAGRLKCSGVDIHRGLG